MMPDQSRPIVGELLDRLRQWQKRTRDPVYLPVP
jgi:hypothetical protein